MVPIIVIVAVLVCALVVGMFFLFRSALLSVDSNAAQDSSATYATDAYVLFAVSGDDGTLVAAYVGYVDSINGRTELCRVEAASRSDPRDLGGRRPDARRRLRHARPRGADHDPGAHGATSISRRRFPCRARRWTP